MGMIFRTVLQSTMTMTVVALLLLWMAPMLAKRYSARSVYTAWIIVLIGFLIPFRMQPAPAPIQVSMPAARVVSIPRSQTPQAAQLPETNAPLPYEEMVTADPSPMQQTEATAQPLPIEIDLVQITGILWACGAAVCLAINAWKHRRFLRTIRRWSRPVQSGTYLQTLGELREALGIRRKVALYRCSVIDSPMLTGLFRPRILMPDTRLSLAEVNLVLRHELTHLRRHDLLWRVLLLVTTAVHWFNPIMIPIARAINIQCEAACDADITKGMTLDMRKVYGETILRSLKRSTGVSTVLSTRFHGDKKTMKKRILGILEMRTKRIGVIMVAAMLTVTLTAGMGVAFSTDGDQQPKNNEERLASLNTRLAQILYEWYELRSLDGNLQGFQFTLPWVSEEDYQAYMAEMDNLNTANAVWQYVRQDGISLPAPSNTIKAAVEDAFDAAGYHEISDVEYFHDISVLSYEPFKAESQWRITAINADGSALGMSVDAEGHVWRLEHGAVSREHPGAKLSDAQRNEARASALAYSKAHMQLQDKAYEHLMVSDYAFTYPDQEDYIPVWVFNRSYPYYDNDDGTYQLTTGYDNNDGYVLMVGAESQDILSISSVSEIYFVNYFLAETDWVARTGLEYPFPDSSYISEILSREWYSRLDSLLGEFGEELAAGDLVKLQSILHSTHLILPDSQWRELWDDIEAASSAADLASIANKDYQGINQSFDGQVTREEIMAKVQPALDALGYGDLPYYAAMYGGWQDSISYNLHLANGARETQLATAFVFGDDGSYPAYTVPESVDLTISSEGKIGNVDSNFQMWNWEPTAPITDEEKKTALEIVNTLVDSGYMSTPELATGDLVIQDEVFITNDGRRIAAIYIMYGDPMMSTYNGIRTEIRDSAMFGIDVQNNKVLSIEYSSRPWIIPTSP